MGKEEFLKRLTDLLRDIPEEEMEDAVSYYRSYLEEAGPEREEEVLAGFGTPEQVAAAIRADLAENPVLTGEFTDQGYTDPRFEHRSFPERPGSRDSWHNASGTERGSDRAGAGGSGVHDSEWKRAPGNQDSPGGREEGSGKRPRSGEKTARPFWQYLLMGLAVIVFGPLVLSVIVGAAGSLFGGLALLVGFFLVLAVLTFAMLLGGISLTVLGMFFVFPGFWPGMLLIGLGLLAFGGGCILLCCSWLFYGCFLPWIGRGIWGIFAKKG